MSLIGAVFGTLLVNSGKSIFSESFPQLWLFFMGGLFVAVVMLFPNGLAGAWDSIRKRMPGARGRIPAIGTAITEKMPPAEFVNAQPE